MKSIGLALVSGAFALSLAGFARAVESPPPGHAAAGAGVFNQCMGCHAVGAGAANGVGPALTGVVGRKAAAASGFHYSSAMKASGLIWTPETLSRFLAAPSDVVPGTHMTFAGLPKAQDRADVVAYLQQQASK